MQEGRQERGTWPITTLLSAAVAIMVKVIGTITFKSSSFDISIPLSSVLRGMAALRGMAWPFAHLLILMLLFIEKVCQCVQVLEVACSTCHCGSHCYLQALWLLWSTLLQLCLMPSLGSQVLQGRVRPAIPRVAMHACLGRNLLQGPGLQMPATRCQDDTP
jgi:hypothetical protein